MRERESKAEIAKRREQTRKELRETPLEKGDFLAMVIAAFIVLLPVILIILALISLILILIFA